MDAFGKIIFALTLRRAALTHEYEARHSMCYPGVAHTALDSFTTLVGCSCGAQIEIAIVPGIEVKVLKKR